MTYNSGSNARFRTPEETLANRQWRLLNSWWILPPVLSCGFLCWLGFLVAAIRTGKGKYWVFCGMLLRVTDLVHGGGVPVEAGLGVNWPRSNGSGRGVRGRGVAAAVRVSRVGCDGWFR